MGYYLNIENLSLEQYKQKIATSYLPPSRKILKENLDERFKSLLNAGFKNVSELRNALNNKKRLLELQNDLKGLSLDYLKILRRELNSLFPKPVSFHEFQCLPDGVSDVLKKNGIENTLQLYSKVFTKQDRIALKEKLSVSNQEILKITSLCDLSRLKWVGATFACMLFELDFCTVKKISVSDPEILHESINKLNKEQNIFKGHIGLNDIRILIHEAKYLSQDIIF